MRQFTGWLLLIVVLCGLGVLMYQDMRLRTARTEIPSAITAGMPEGAGDEPAPNAPVPESPAPPSAAGGKASVAETPPAGEPPARAVASAEPPPAVETRAAADAPPASGDATPSAQPSGESAAATPPAPAPASSAAPVTPPDAAASPAEPPAAVATESAETSAPAAAPTTEPAPDAAGVAPELAPPSVPETPAAEVAAAPVAEEPVPEVPPAEAALEPPATVPDAAGGTEVAVAPEIETQPQPGTTPPASESSGRDSMMQASPGTEPAPPAADTVIAAIDPSADVEAPRPTVVPDAIAPGTDSQTAAAPPTFDVVRVEPTGDAVVAGVAPPGATVELIDGATTVATAVASDTGEWAMALDQPLPAGEHDLALRATSEDTGVVIESEQRVAVLVPETVAEEPLVVLNAPDAASTILQVPATPEPAPAAVAALDAPATPDAGAALPEGEEAAVPVDTPVAEAASPPPADTPVTAVAVPEPATDDAAAEPPPAEPEVAAATPLAEPAVTPAAPATTEPAASGTEPAAPDVAVAEPEPAPEPEPEPVVAPVVAVTAVEAESSGALFVAGTATTPEDVRVYVDDVLLGEVTPSPSGTWLVEVKRELPAGTYRVRADQVEPGAGTVLARAEVPFERDVEVAILRPVAEVGGGTGAEATGTMAGPTTLIIKRSDNLWRISRQLYGKGIRWSTIYEANKDQIRNPRWIYPGQVFILPEGNAAWTEEAAD
jgi:nucleoid-associated protein YgaU